MPITEGKCRNAVFWGIGIVVGLFLLALSFQSHQPPVSPEDTYRNIVKKSEALSQLRISLLTSGQMEKNAVMAITDEESKAFADQSRAASAAAEESNKLIHSLVDASSLKEEQRFALEFDNCWGELRKLDQTILELAVQNTNLKAARLSQERGAETMQRFTGALTDLINFHAGQPHASRINELSYRAATAALTLFTLHSSHIAEASDVNMDQIEKQMKLDEDMTRQSLAALDGLVAAEDREALARAQAALTDFLAVTTEVIELSRQNSNVKSFELSLGRKRKVAAQCDEILSTFQETVHNRTFKATR